MGCRKLDIEAKTIQNIINFITILNFDYDSYYMTLLKNALKYGMKKEEFWKDNIQDYFVYEEAYVEKIHEQSHIQGLYNYIAIETICANLFKKKGEKTSEYPKESLLLKNDKKQNVKNIKPKKKEDIEQIYFEKLAQCV